MLGLWTAPEYSFIALDAGEGAEEFAYGLTDHALGGDVRGDGFGVGGATVPCGDGFGFGREVSGLSGAPVVGASHHPLPSSRMLLSELHGLGRAAIAERAILQFGLRGVDMVSHG